MRKSKTLIYAGLGIFLLIVIAYLGGYRLSPASISKELDHKAHFTPSEIIYSTVSGDKAVIVTKHEDWLQCRVVQKAFGFLWKDTVSFQPIELKDYPDISENDLVKALAARFDWPQALIGIESATVSGNEAPIELTPQMWWNITELLNARTWIKTTASTAGRTLAMTLTDSAGKTYSFYDGGTVLIIVNEASGGTESGRYLMNRTKLTGMQAAVDNAIEIMKQNEATKVFVSQLKLTDFYNAASMGGLNLWNSDFIPLKPDQSEQLKTLLKLDDWKLIKLDSGFEDGSFTLVDENGLSYLFKKGTSSFYVMITDFKKPSDHQYATAPLDISESIITYVDSLRVIVPPSADMLAMNFTKTTIGVNNTLSKDPSEIPTTTIKGYTYAITQAQNETLKGLLKVSSWNKFDQPFKRQDGDTFFSTKYVLTGSSGEKIYFSDETTGLTKVIVQFKTKTEYYTMASSDCIAAQNYLASLYQPQAPIAKILNVNFTTYIRYWNETGGVDNIMTAKQAVLIKTLLNMSSWRQAINRDVMIPTPQLISLVSTDHLYFYVMTTGDQVQISIIDGSTNESYYNGFAWSYLAPVSIKNDLLDFIKEFK